MQYGQTHLRNSNSIRSITPLTDEQMRKVAPSIFADGKHESRSDRYTYIPTSAVLQGLRKEGFEAFSVCQTRVRDEGKREHAKHLVRLRHVGAVQPINVGDSVLELCLLNSHDGSSSYHLYPGVFRYVCTNGLMVPECTLPGVKVQHTGKVQDKVIEGAYEILEGCTRVVESRESMQALTLSQEEQAIFARGALSLRYTEDDTPAPVTDTGILASRRQADNGNDLWRTFNRVQENVIRGGVRGRNAQGRPMRTREVQGIDQNVRLNRALWTLAEEMRRLKGAA